ncbi:hypothetical protein EDC39_11363 [Geothermobacter ehrlichii]|uniref:Lipoprotein n=1 Tax=Geothermobacter ehrlichii TaxID=213224 RepID=A0A5D3WJC3_9BACT|nr:hypothetical protein [Geothermobacter ehrlichii]TYO96673.1 hypothetical protein EDC39_11363 [Geothermobacter ehrlichii]
MTLVRMFRGCGLLCLMLLLVAACSSRPEVHKKSTFTVVPSEETLYVVPFTTIMVPQAVSEGIFDRFVDALIEKGVDRKYNVVILKQGLKEIAPDWLASHYYITGDLFAYVEESGCCSTTIRSRSRIRLFQPGSTEPVLMMEYPREVFFDHDYSTIEQQRRLLARDIADTLAGYLIDALSKG